MIDDMIAWWREQLDDDKRIAVDVDEAEWRLDTVKGITVNEFNQSSREHIVRHDPARVLREVEAKRRIIALHDRAWANVQAHPYDLASKGAALQMIAVVKILALPYADRPGYRPEWAPTGSSE